MSTRRAPKKTTSKTTKIPSRPKNKPTNATLADLRPGKPQQIAVPPARTHASSYHYPLLLGAEDGGKEACEALLRWFEEIHDERDMPWRKEWIDPQSFVGKDGSGDEGIEKVLARRAYEVWVSEIMLQQTRVSTVIPYFKTWISKWPTVQDLAAANPDEVLSVWKGLGYYSRATRLHQGAQEMIAKNPINPVPSGVVALQDFPGIGRYTAGAVSSIAFGEAEPVLDGNVARVLSRQLGLYVDAKDKKSVDFMWMAADGLVKHVSGVKKSKIPGQWNQALMELGSTVCTPRPKCEECPIQRTCRAYAEGDALSKKAKADATVPVSLPDIEDACSLCEQLDTEDLAVAPEEDEDEAKVVKKRKQETRATSKISHYFAASTPKEDSVVDIEEIDENIEVPGTKKRKALQSNASSKYRATYCSLFPKKMPKKKVAEEECVVCIIKSSDEKGNDEWFIEQRPAKGLLASLWQFPQSTIPASKSSASHRKTAAQKYIRSLDAGHANLQHAMHVAELDSLVHVFTHLKLTMHIHLFTVDADTEAAAAFAFSPTRKWVPTEAMDNETLSTGMRRCWDLAKARWAEAPLSCLDDFYVGPITHAGMHRRTAALTMIFQSLFCGCGCGIQFWIYGYSQYQSHTTGPFIGDISLAGLRNVLAYPSLANPDIPDIHYAAFGFTFVTCTAMVFAGAMLERGRLWPSMLFPLCWTTFFYYIIAYWEWNPSGWLYKLGVMDFAGSGPVHIASGFAALAWAIVLGYRKDPHSESLQRKLPHFRPHNPFLVGLGTILIWFGRFAFNGASTAGFVPVYVASLIDALTSCYSFMAVKYKHLIGVDEGLDIFAIHGVGGFFASKTIPALDRRTNTSPGG